MGAAREREGADDKREGRGSQADRAKPETGVQRPRQSTRA